MDDVNFDVIDDKIFLELEDVTVTQLDNLPTQDLLVGDENKNPRFRDVLPLSEVQLESLKQDRLPKNTRRQNSWASTAFADWARWRNTQFDTFLCDRGSVPTSLANESKESINYWMSRFVVECRRQDGSPYPPNSLYNIVTGIQRMLREEQGRNDIKFLDDTDCSFAELRKQLDARMKELTNLGVGIHRNRADPVTTDDECQLWDKGVIGTTSAKALSYGVFFYNCKVFGFRGSDEHRELQTSQYRFTEENGQKVLIFQGRSAKNLQGGLKQRRVEPKSIKQYADSSNVRCIVNLFDIYLSYVPDGDFYVRPLPANLRKEIKFSSQKIGVNTLNKYMKSMFTEADICMENRNIRNHSGKVTLCSRLYEQNFDEQAIMSRSGHRSLAVRDYKRPSVALQQSLSSALQPPTGRSETPPPPPSSDKSISTKTEPSDQACIEITVSSVTKLGGKTDKRRSVTKVTKRPASNLDILNTKIPNQQSVNSHAMSTHSLTKDPPEPIKLRTKDGGSRHTMGSTQSRTSLSDYNRKPPKSSNINSGVILNGSATPLSRLSHSDLARNRKESVEMKPMKPPNQNGWNTLRNHRAPEKNIRNKDEVGSNNQPNERTVDLIQNLRDELKTLKNPQTEDDINNKPIRRKSRKVNKPMTDIM